MRRAKAFRAIIIALAPLSHGCNETPIHGRQFLAAPTIRHAQEFQTFIVSNSSDRCVIRTRLPNGHLAASWVDERNSALRAAHRQALSCCSAPKLQRVEDWMVGFSAFEATFVCPQG